MRKMSVPPRKYPRMIAKPGKDHAGLVIGVFSFACLAILVAGMTGQNYIIKTIIRNHETSERNKATNEFRAGLRHEHDAWARQNPPPRPPPKPRDLPEPLPDPLGIQQYRDAKVVDQF